ncbi:MAG: hypothetical protein KDA28_11775 [Phycisphaerales bacterium]|nr:hypothetical protein [Phycisphaerales bacterium]
MQRCEIDKSIERVVLKDMSFPLGVYPIEDLEPCQGYTVDFESADGGEASGDWEEWPDRYVLDIVLTADRLNTLCRALFAMLPGRIYPILDVIGNDAYREIDPYISYDLIGLDRFLEAYLRYRPFFLEDGLTGFGAMCDDPFLYIFVDEHKIVTVRAQPEYKERIEKLLHGMGLKETEQPAGADSAAHEHRTVLLPPEKNPDALTPEEVIERLRDDWKLVLNIDSESNLDDQGNDLGVTAWRCIVRCFSGTPLEARYAEILLHASSFARAEDTCQEALATLLGVDRDQDAILDSMLLFADRLSPEQFAEAARRAGKKPGSRVSDGTVVSSVLLDS